MPGPARTYGNNAARQRAYRARCRATAATAWHAAGLPALPRIASVPGTVRWRALVQQAQALLDTAVTEMQEYYDGRSATWQEGERGERFLERLEALQEACRAVEELDR